MRFESDRVTIGVKERTREAGVTFEGKLKK
jgi:hypothetical protein